MGKKFEKKYEMDRANEDDLLGTGNFATVRRAYSKGNGDAVAVKLVSKKKLHPEEKKSLNREIEILESIDHPCVMKCHEHFETKDEVLMVLELLEGGELFQRIVDRNQYSERDAASALKNVFETLKFLHGKDIVHRDLKPENLLLVSKTDDIKLKLADFGFATYATEPLTEGCGTLLYVAPEILLKQEYWTAPDMWSMGVITYILLCGYPPFFDPDQDRLAKKVVRGKYKFRDEDWADISDDAKNFVRALLQRNPEDRMTAEEALEHPWIKNLAAVPDDQMDAEKLRVFLAKERMRKAVTAVKAINKLQNLNLSLALEDDL